MFVENFMGKNTKVFLFIFYYGGFLLTEKLKSKRSIV